LIDKLVTLVGTKDPLAYQQVASMNVVSTDDIPYDPSDEGELARIHARNVRLGNLNDPTGAASISDNDPLDSAGLADLFTEASVAWENSYGPYPGS
jgi:hypothetical protein